MAESYKLTYFNAKGRGEPIRLLFAYAGVDYEDNRIVREEWPEQKKNYPWGQLPVLQVGEKTLCQSNAICRYLARKFNLLGDDAWETAKIDEFIDAMGDLTSEWRKFFMEKDEVKKAELKKEFMENVAPKYLLKFEQQIKSKESPYMVGKRISWLDIQMAYLMDVFQTTDPGSLDSFPALKQLVKTVFEVPQIKAWVDKRPVTMM